MSPPRALHSTPTRSLRCSNDVGFGTGSWHCVTVSCSVKRRPCRVHPEESASLSFLFLSAFLSYSLSLSLSRALAFSLSLSLSLSAFFPLVALPLHQRLFVHVIAHTRIHRPTDHPRTRNRFHACVRFVEVCLHLGDLEALERAAGAGIDEWTHAVQLMLAQPAASWEPLTVAAVVSKMAVRVGTSAALACVGECGGDEAMGSKTTLRLLKANALEREQAGIARQVRCWGGSVAACYKRRGLSRLEETLFGCGT